jgi:hypothetical protein
LIQLPLGRQEKRRRKYLIGWFTKYWNQIEPLVADLVLEREDGRVIGPEARRWNQFLSENPMSDTVRCANSEFDGTKNGRA